MVHPVLALYHFHRRGSFVLYRCVKSIFFLLLLFFENLPNFDRMGGGGMAGNMKMEQIEVMYAGSLG